ncbi:flavodoxin domain-containing protein [Arcanobacterium hippocoleae]|uniref:Menaquinone-dependent protoporphyrinogen oxidase n=1 Tax=Arcanobacterium hippocoleae TaxID=149017 RepID=A0ABU1T438_9ACTO|nr:flavodoxin domain-containing protein [Arcanobacterium hippocoleae]MDR6940147.1 menaquinone-dependent protoporphyrinogen oxidase [Arcanobacterium hippocoleae]
MKIVALYSSRFGHTLRIVNEMAYVWREQGISVEIRPVCAARKFPADADGVVLAGSVRYGFYSPKMRKFAKRFAAELNQLPSAFVGVSLSSEKREKSTVDTNVYAQKFFRNLRWKPAMAKLFTGEVNFDLYRGVDKVMLNKILEISGKPHGEGVKVDYTDWDAVREFAVDFAKLIA